MPSKQQKKDWKRFINIWKKLRPPVVPSKGEIQIYKHFIKDNKGKKALVFGATPQLRDLLCELGYQVTAIDFNEQNIYVMTNLMNHKPKDENVIVGNWLKINKMKLPKFDVIVGDHFLNNLAFKYWDFILKNIKKLLKPDGFFVTNIMVSFDEDGKVKNKKVTNIKDRFLQFYKTCLNSSLFDKKKQEYNCFEYDKYIKKLMDTGIISKQAGESLLVNIFTTDFKMAQPRINVVERLLKKYFKISGKKHYKQHPVFKYYQIYKLIQK